MTGELVLHLSQTYNRSHGLFNTESMTMAAGVCQSIPVVPQLGSTEIAPPLAILSEGSVFLVFIE